MIQFDTHLSSCCLAADKYAAHWDSGIGLMSHRVIGSEKRKRETADTVYTVLINT